MTISCFQLLKMKIVAGLVVLLSVGMVHGLTQGMITAVNLGLHGKQWSFS